MAQHDFVIDNSTGQNVRSDINNVLKAILTNNSGTTDPATVIAGAAGSKAFSFWADTNSSPAVLKIRNAADNGWIELFQLDGTLTLEDGSASTPGLAFRDDLNTGIFSSAADTFNVATGGVERMELGATTIFNEDGADVDFRIEGENDANLFKLDAGNDKITIGGSSPSAKLAVLSDTAFTAFASAVPNSTDCMLVVSNNPSSEAANRHATIQFGVNGGTHNRVASISAVAESASNRKLALAFCTDSSSNRNERMRLTGDGELAIGTTTIPTGFKLIVNGDLSLGETSGTDNTFIDQKQNGALEIINSGIGSNNAGMIRINRYNDISGGTTAFRDTIIYNGKNTAILTVDGSAASVGMGLIDLGASGPASRIDPVDTAGCLLLEADPGNNYGSSNIKFHVDNGEVMRIVRGSNPFVAIGRTNQQGNEGFTVDRNGTDVCFFTQNSSGTLVTLKLLNKRATSSTEGEQISFLDESGNQRGKIINNTSTTTYVTSSDYRLKENQVEISDGIDRVKQLKPYKFNWKNRPGIIVDGFFAHEVENLVKDCVSGTKDRVVTQDDHNKGDYLDKNIDEPLYQMIDNSQIVPLLTSALKEAITKIETLETKVAALEAA